MAANQFPSPCVKWNPECQLAQLRNASFHWAHILNNTYTGIPSLRLPPMAGAIFSGPPGNGRHLTAEALAGTLRASSAGYYCLRIAGCALDTEEVADACAVLDAVNDAFRDHPKICLLLDHPEHSRHSLAIQEYLYQLFLARKNSLFPILVTDDPASVSANLLRKLTLCPCSNPDQATRQTWFKGTLEGKPKAGIPPLPLNGMNEITLARETKDFSWKQMQDLKTLLQRQIAFKYLSNLATYNPDSEEGKGEHLLKLMKEGKISLNKEEVMPLILLVRTQSAPAAPAGAVQVIAAAGGVVPAAAPSSSSEKSAEAPGERKKFDEMSLEEQLDIDNL